MQNTFKMGDRVRVRGAEPVGTVNRVEGAYVNVTYDHGRSRSSFGDYPASHVELVEAAPREEAKDAKPDTRPRAKTSDIISTADRV